VLILLICAALAVAVCAPLIYIVRRLKRRSTGGAQAPTGRPPSTREVISGLVLVFTLFLAFAQQYIAPDSWLGARVATNEGRFWFTVLVVLVVSVGSHLEASLMARRSNAERANQDTRSPPGGKADDDP
jgi:hypothetical protein